MKTKIGLFFLAFLTLFMVGCARNISTNIFRFETHLLEIEVGSSKELIITGDYDPSSEIVYTILEGGEEYVALIQGERLHVQGLKEGSTRIVASVIGNENLRAVADIQVITPKASSVQITRPIGFTDQMNIGEVAVFSAVVTPAIAGPAVWSTTDESKATIDQNGVLTAINGGDVSVIATSLDEKTSARINLTIAYHPVASVSLSVKENNSTYATPSQMNRAYLRETISLQAIVAPATANPTITWSSSNPAIATVDSNGRVFGAGVGSSIITARTINNTILATMSVQFAFAPVQSVDLTVDDYINLVAGTGYILGASVIPSNANPAINWAIVDGNNISVADPITNTTQTQVAMLSGTTVIGIYQGTIIVRASSVADPTKNQDITINVTPRPAPQQIVVSTPDAALRKTIEFHTSESGFVLKDDQDIPHFIFDDTISIAVSVSPANAYQDLMMFMSEEGIVKLSGTTISTITGEMIVHFWVLQPGTVTITFVSRYSHYYTELEQVHKQIVISEHIFEEEFDNPEAGFTVTIGGTEHIYYVSGTLEYFEEYLDQLYDNYTWRTVIGEGGFEDGIVFSTDGLTYYLTKPGIYYMEAVSDGDVVYRVTVQARQISN